MLYRRFGKTELQMPLLSCGGMRYQHAWKDCPPGEIPADGQANLEATIHRALELGINHIETARGYGTSEMQLGKVLPHLPRDQIKVQTKVEPTPTTDQFYKSFDKSMDYLNLDYVDLLALHGLNNRQRLENALKPGGCLEAALKLRDQGRTRFVGFSTHARTDLILEAIKTDAFDYINLHYYYIFQNNWPAIEAAAQRDMGVFIISPSDKGGMLYKPSEKLVRLCRPLSPMVFNDLFCLSRPQIHTISLGAARPSDFDEHLKALDLLAGATELIEPIVQRLDQKMRDRLGEQWLQTWQVGLPSHRRTPGGINIAALLFLRNLALAFDMVDYGKMRYKLFGEGEHWFPGERIESLEYLRELDFGQCLSGSPNAGQIPGCLEEAFALLNEEPPKTTHEKTG